MPRGQKIDPALLQAALVGLEQRLAETNANIETVKRMLRIGNRSNATPAAAVRPVKRRRRKMSAAARRRIAEAQKRRWAAFRAKTGGRKTAAKSAS